MKDQGEDGRLADISDEQLDVILATPKGAELLQQLERAQQQKQELKALRSQVAQAKSSSAKASPGSVLARRKLVRDFMARDDGEIATLLRDMPDEKLDEIQNRHEASTGLYLLRKGRGVEENDIEPKLIHQSQLAKGALTEQTNIQEQDPEDLVSTAQEPFDVLALFCNGALAIWVALTARAGVSIMCLHSRQSRTRSEIIV